MHAMHGRLLSFSPDLLHTEGPGEALSEDVSVQLLYQGDAPLIPGLCPRPPVKNHHALRKGPDGQLHFTKEEEWQ